MLKLLSIAVSLTVLVSAAAPKEKWILPQGSGPYKVGLEIKELVDSTRLDPWNASHVRRMMVSRFDPIESEDCKRTELQRYMPDTVARVESEILSEYDYPAGIWAKFWLETCAGKKRRKEPRGKFPVALFGPGLNTTRLFYSSLAQEIASHGITVVTMDHPYDVDVVEFPNGDVIYGGRVAAENTIEAIEKALDVRAQDANFVLDALHLGKHAVMLGHSFGGAASATAMRKYTRIRGGANIDGLMYGPVVSKGIPRAKDRSFLLWSSEEGAPVTNETWSEFYESLEESGIGWRREMRIEESVHGSYWDINVLVDIVGLREQLSEVALSLVGPVPGARVWEIMGRYLPAYIKFALGLKPEDRLYREPSSEFPEVNIERS